MKRFGRAGIGLSLAGCFFLVSSLDSFAGEANPPPPAITQVTVVSNSQRQITWTPYPAAEQFRILSTTNLGQPFVADGSGAVSGYGWKAPLSSPSTFHCLEVVPLSSNALLSATVLNRLTYGPTPSEIERIAAIGPQGTTGGRNHRGEHRHGRAHHQRAAAAAALHELDPRHTHRHRDRDQSLGLPERRRPGLHRSLPPGKGDEPQCGNQSLEESGLRLKAPLAAVALRQHLHQLREHEQPPSTRRRRMAPNACS